MIKMRKWDVWQLDQGKSKLSSDPTQPSSNDPRPKRFYVIVSSQAHLDSMGSPTCIPIFTNGNGTLACVAIKSRPSGLDYDSFAWCNTIYTIPRGAFLDRKGYLNKDERNEINESLRDYLGLHED